MSESNEEQPLGATRGTWGSVLAAPRLIPTPRLSQPSTNTSVLRPPQLKAGSNPFLRVPTRDVECNNTVSTTTLTPEGNHSSPCPEDPKEEKKSEENAAPKFLPLHTSRESISFAGGAVPEPTPEGRTRTSNFVFGQNLQDRVVKQDNADQESLNNKTTHPATNGSSELLFSSALHSTSDSLNFKPKDDVGSTSQASTTSSVWGGIPETTPLPPTLPSGPILTGEEGENNVFQGSCRLFAFEGGQWKERCRGQLRLNDSDIGSRLVCRATGSLRVLLNTKVWGDMTVDRAGFKSLRVTATDSQNQVKVFLVMASRDEIAQLYNALSTRVAQAKRREETNAVRKSAEAPGVSEAETANSSNDKSESEAQAESESCTFSATSDTTKPDLEAQIDSTSQNQGPKPGNPVIIMTADDDDSSSASTLKRPLESEDDLERSKKVCTESIGPTPLL